MRKFVLLLPLAGLVTGGCVAKAAWDVATLPVKAGSQAVDWSTTSQEEADRNYGRKMRKQEAEEGKQRKKWEKHCKKNPDDPNCAQYSGYRAGDGDPTRQN
ncbi:hypothetical protein LZK98_19910 [Sphingomonas cannabina]|uniref:hypothetical protein n=1 Tax=Sphingomonas cannabina TaxID=2899123 RepID=UPI001F1681AE|nr:hypothetical protein [Sphingomonas cannabina]UIJ45277.1 hypothetical protein LZK98_19910 [Sphingomonas cannabina]